MIRLIFISIIMIQPLPIQAGQELQASFYKALQRIMPNIPPSNVEKSELNGVLKVSYGPKQYYITYDGQYLLGSLININTGKDAISDSRRKQRIAAIDDAFSEEDMIVYGSSNYKYTITVFTDVGCSYCREMHENIEGFIRNGIRVRYLFYPRSGMASRDARIAESIYCTTDRNSALTDAKNGLHVEQNKCDNPVHRSYVMGRMIGLKGTPSVILENGHLIEGMLTPAKLLALLKQPSS